MRLLMLGAILIAALVADLRPSAAEVVYPWCAYYGRVTRNCGFVSFQQCLATVQGTGGSCEINTRYNAPLAPGDRKVRRAD
jgi:uncharacterized membrane protein